MSMLNFTIYNKTDQKHWCLGKFLISVNPPDATFRGFYYQEGTRFIEGGPNSAQLAIQWHDGNVCPHAY